ncbi:hypothetical protein MDA_GLEAN10018633 [Myotis davidii]|uniref:Uncharacterized protein n=1 Tax=Myotis davidii TaxID=225400 RepID=L5M4M6_MYODS|nr:hypothetical protein MDA_GLEAN10018633 [Myotis davidii]
MAGIGSRRQNAEHGGYQRWQDGGAGERGHQTRLGTGCCHGGEPLMVTENSLLPCSTVPPSACTCYLCQPPHICCWCQSHHSCLLSALSASPDCSVSSVGASGSYRPQTPLRASPFPPAPEGQLGQQLPLAPLTAPAPLAPAAGTGPNRSTPSAGIKRGTSDQRLGAVAARAGLLVDRRLGAAEGGAG